MRLKLRIFNIKHVLGDAWVGPNDWAWDLYDQDLPLRMDGHYRPLLWGYAKTWAEALNYGLYIGGEAYEAASRDSSWTIRMAGLAGQVR